MLEKIFSSQIRSKILIILFDGRLNSYHMREIERLTSMSIGAVQYELSKLVEFDLILKTIDGNRNCYKANTTHPIYEDLCNIVRKTEGFEVILKKELENYTPIQIAFIFGSYARNQIKSTSDIDLFLIGEIGFRDVIASLKKVEMETNREINPHIYSKTEFHKKLMIQDHFITSLFDSEKIFIIGNINEFRELVKE